jgi:uncharacterized membrane protein YccC
VQSLLPKVPWTSAENVKWRSRLILDTTEGQVKVCVNLENSSVICGSKWQRAWRVFVSLHSEPKEGDLDWAQGLRGAVGISIPAAAGLLANHLPWGILCAFATLWILSCDVGGAYRQKAAALAGSGLTVLVAYVFAGWMVQSVANYIIGTFVWVFAAALIGVAGNAAAQAGLVSSTVVVTSVVLVVPSEFWIRLPLCLVGICWALFLSLALWPLKPYSPLFQAVSASCMKLAHLADAFWSGAPTTERAAINLEFAVAYDDFVNSLEGPRNIWGAVRAHRAGPTLRSMQLLALIEQLDDVARTLVALREIVNLVGKEKWFDEVRESYVDMTRRLSQLGREMAAAVAVRGKNVDPAGLHNAFQKLRSTLAAERQDQSPTLLQRKELGQTTKHLIEQVSDLAETVSELKSGRPHFRVPPEAGFGPRPKSFDAVAEIRNNLSHRSSSFRHALRLGVTTAFASLMASAFHLVRGYWIPMTVVLVLKPNFGGTLQRSVQRITGTVLGALIAAVLLLAIKNAWLLLAAVAALAFATFSLRNRNYGLFALALTPMIMLMLDLARPVTVTDSFLRIFHTIIGSSLALLSGYLLFPMWESRRLPLHIAEALQAEAAFLRALRDALRGQEKRPMSEFRRDAAVAVSNAATAGQRLLTEPPSRRGDVEAAAAAISYCRRILHALAAISDYLTRESIRLESDYLTKLFDVLANALEDLAASLQMRTDPSRFPDLSEFSQRLEKALQAVPLEMEEAANLAVENPKNNEAQAWLFYHLKNVSHLTLAVREVLSRLLQSEARIPRKMALETRH